MRLAGFFKDCLAPCHLLPSSDGHVTVAAVDLDRPAEAPGRFRSKQHRARPEETVEHDVTAIRNIEKSVFELQEERDAVSNLGLV